MQPLEPYPYSHCGTGGQGCLLQATSSNSQLSAFGHWTSLHGSWHWHLGHPASSRAKPCGHSMRHMWAAHGFGSAMKSSTIFNTLFHKFINALITLFQSPLGIISPPTLTVEISMKSSTEWCLWLTCTVDKISGSRTCPRHLKARFFHTPAFWCD